MKIRTSFFGIVMLTLFRFISAQLNVVVSIPDIADIAENIGGKTVQVFSLAKGTEDVHLIRARSSFLPKINRADLVLSLGLAAEERWLPAIVAASRNKRVKKGNPGWVEVYSGLNILEKPEDPAVQHDETVHHRFGNPHYNSGPYCGKIIAENIYKTFSTHDPKNKDLYFSRYQEYFKKLDKMENDLLQRAAPLREVSVITYHADLSYFCSFYGIKLTGCIEPKPGVFPNSRHIVTLVEKARKDKTKLILYHQAQNPRLPNKIAKETGAQPVCFANMVKSRETIHTFIDLQHYNLDLMLEALKK